MQLNAWVNSSELTEIDCLTVFIDQSGSPCGEIENNLEPQISSALNSGALGSTMGSALLLPNATTQSPKALLLFRLPLLPLASGKLRELCGKLASKLVSLNFATAGINFSGITSAANVDTIRQVGIDLISQHYRFEDFKSIKKPAHLLKQVYLGGCDEAELQSAVDYAQAVGDGINLTRDLGNMPGNACTPSYLATCATEMAVDLSIDTSVLNENEMQELGMGSLLSVSAGSEQPAKLIIMEYRGGDEKDAPFVLVGKGITFDTGGISLKPGAAMDEMKFDMCGAASVFGVIQAVARLKPSFNLVGIVAAAENMPNGNATKPGDIVKSMSGQTIEILNTDAEGRLVLCDALTYAARFEPRTIIDIATLTGACVIALGKHASGLFANNDDLAEALLAAGDGCGDRAWRMPLWPEYEKQLESNFADMANIGGREAGSVTAACFLSKFVRDQKWAHIDIAGTGWHSGKNKGASGRPVRLLVDYLMSDR